MARLRKTGRPPTGEKRKGAALRQSEDYFRAITQNSSDLMIVVDENAIITDVNASVEHFLGYRPEELIGKSAFDYIAQADLLRAMDNFSQAIRTVDEIIPNMFTIKHKDGSERVLEGVGNNLLDHPHVAGFVMNVRDVTERKKAEAELNLYRKHLEDLVKERTAELVAMNGQLLVQLTERRHAEDALRQSEDRFRTLIQKSTDVVSIIDERGLFAYNSPAAETVLRYPSEQLIGKSPFDFIHTDDRPLAEKRLTEVVSGTNAGLPSEFRFLRGDGSWINLESVGTNLLDYPGINGIVITSRDITERKLLEGRLHRAEKMESLGTLAGGVAHDLNNVLGVLVGYCELLSLELPDGNPLRKRVTSIMQSSERAAAIIQDLLTLARRGVTVSDVVNLNNVISTYIKTPEFEKLRDYHPAVRFHIQLADDLLNIKGSPVHLGKTIMNLLSNAAEAISTAGNVMVRTQNCHLDKPIRGYDDTQEGDYAVLTVSDSGIGILAPEIEKIFEPFYTKKVMGRSGTGLGLTVVWGTVKDHNGYIDVQSTHGQGTTFMLYFPATREALRGIERTAPLDQYMGAGESILVVDDVKDQREVATSMLSRLGYRVRALSSGEEAVAYLKDHAADLVLLDMIMDPGIDGLETYRRILKIHPHQKAIVVSGFSETERVKQAERLGAGAYVKKPYMLERIGTAIRDVLTKTTRN